MIKKNAMAERVSKAADASLGLADRLRQAQSLTSSHPAPDAPMAPSAPINSMAITGLAKDGRLEAVPLNLIDPNPFNARQVYRPQRVTELAASIAAHGQDVPGIATIRGGRYILAAGHYRLRAIKNVGLSTMDLMIHEGLTDRDLFAYSYRENAEREGQTTIDNALSWRHLLDSELYGSETEIAEATGMSLPNVNKTLQVLELPLPVLEFVRESPDQFGLSYLYELVLYARVAGADAALTMAQKVVAGEVCRSDITEARLLVSDPKERKRKETSRPYRLQSDGLYAGSLKVFADSGRVTLDVVYADAALREKLLAQLKAHFSVTE